MKVEIVMLIPKSILSCCTKCLMVIVLFSLFQVRFFYRRPLIRLWPNISDVSDFVNSHEWIELFSCLSSNWHTSWKVLLFCKTLQDSARFHKILQCTNLNSGIYTYSIESKWYSIGGNKSNANHKILYSVKWILLLSQLTRGW